MPGIAELRKDVDVSNIEPGADEDLSFEGREGEVYPGRIPALRERGST